MIISREHISAYLKFAQRKKNDRLRRQLNSAGRGCSCEEKCSFTNRRDRASLCFARAIQTRTRSIRAPRGWCHLTCRAVTEPKTASARCYSTPRAHPLNILSKLKSHYLRRYFRTFVLSYFRKYESTFVSTKVLSYNYFRSSCSCTFVRKYLRTLLSHQSKSITCTCSCTT